MRSARPTIARLGPLLVVVLMAETGYLAYGPARRLVLGIEASEALRGQRIAQQSGCFGCHGPGGTGGVPNPGSKDEIPGYRGGMIMMYAESDQEIREWILDGAPRRLRDDPDFRSSRERSSVVMPAFRGRLSENDVDRLVVYLKNIAGLVTPPPTTPARAGFDLAWKSGCFGCHGDGGMGGVANPGSLKGYIPGWWGADYVDLVRGDGELREWIESGTIARLATGRLARHYLERQVISMPAYRDHLKAADIDSIMAYVNWVRMQQAGR